MSTTFVIARYKEDIDWLCRLPSDSVVYLYNKGPEINPGNLPSNVRVRNIPNVGRESGTYLYYMMNDFRKGESEFTVFTQADPFEHSPDFLNLVKRTDQWRDIQPLSLLWIADKNIPPVRILDEERSDWLDDLAVRAEHFSLKTWAPLGFFDEGAWGIGQTYRQKHLLPAGYNIAAHFFEMAGLDDLARAAFKAEFGVFSYGAIYGVKSSLVERFVSKTSPLVFDRLALLSRADPNYGYIFERIWLHLFGEPFFSFEPVKKPQSSEHSPVQVNESVDLGMKVQNLRQQAFQASQSNHGDEAIALLKEALLIKPNDAEILCDLATMAFQNGRYEDAIAYTKRSTESNKDHFSSLFILAMSLSATGQLEEAIASLHILLSGPGAAVFVADQSEMVKMAEQELHRLTELANRHSESNELMQEHA